MTCHEHSPSGGGFATVDKEDYCSDYEVTPVLGGAIGMASDLFDKEQHDTAVADKKAIDDKQKKIADHWTARTMEIFEANAKKLKDEATEPA